MSECGRRGDNGPVDRDGVPRYQLYTVEGIEDGQNRWFEMELTVTGVGSTTVETVRQQSP